MKLSRKWLPLTMLAVTGSVLIIFIFSHSSHKPSSKAANPISAKVASLPKVAYRGLPARLLIPAINVDTSIEYMGIDVKGDMAVPTGSTNVGWYKFGAIPGDPGSAVIAGHVVGSRGQPGVFINLDKLQAGNEVSVVDAKGNAATFLVRGIKSYDQTQEPTEVFNSSTGTHLNLITCAGDWDATQLHYQKRLVVFTDRI